MTSESTPVRYRIRHRTEYQYSQRVGVCQNQIRMQPVSGGQVTCDASEITIDPTPTTQEKHNDYFGNRVLSFSIEAMHQSLVVEAISQVRIAAAPWNEASESPPWNSLLASAPGQIPTPRRDEHRYASPRIVPGSRFAEYAKVSLSSDRPILEAALELTKRIHDDFRYDSSATTVKTTTEEAFDLRAGVCQDFAHVQIACLRSLGLAARYVSGYLRTKPPPGKERLVGADESHAWLEVFAGDGLGWVGLDPTNACLANQDHIPICVGRDYSDVSPMRGVVLGGGTNTLKVSVDVEPIADETQPQPAAS
jgi:transglutaminase-like putative cysteine protease